MSTSELLAIIASGVVSFMVFLLKYAVNSVNDRIDMLGSKVDILVEKFAASAVRAENNAAEIERFRTRLHDISNIVTEVQMTQKRCKQCNS